MAQRCLVPLLALLTLLNAASISAAAPRVASLGVCADQILLRLADPDQIVGLSPQATDPTLSLYAREAARYPQHTGGAESLLAAGADLVLAPPWGESRTVALLRRLGVRVERLPSANTFADIAATTRAMGALLGHPKRGEALARDLEQRVAALKARTRDHPRPLAAYYRPGGGSAGPATYVGAALTLGGVDNLLGTLGTRSWGDLPLEQLVMTPPDVYVLSFMHSIRRSLLRWHARHGAIRRLTADTPVIGVPGRDWTCAAWPVISAAETVADGVARLRAEGRLP